MSPRHAALAGAALTVALIAGTLLSLRRPVGPAIHLALAAPEDMSRPLRLEVPRTDADGRLGLKAPVSLLPAHLTPPPLPREFRGAWIASVGNVDWPSKAELSVADQQSELLALFDRAVSLKLNAVILQVRPSCDALYASRLEPWSQYLTGEMGKAPVPYYDPLEFAVTEAHKRGLELHAWFNPFRALTTTRNLKGVSPTHITQTNPELVRKYGDLLWLDPGEPEAQRRALAVILDVVHRYDIDAVHLDDYFYPYVQKDKRGRPLSFPDEASFQKYVAGGGTLLRDDWRRENINEFVRQLYERIKGEKQWVKVGISPFGIWRPQKELSISGLDSYAEIYADSRKWLQNGWLDYISPQLYWSTDAPKQSYPVLLQWWTEANSMQRHLWPGIATDRISAERSASDILGQISLTRARNEAAAGNIHWHIKSLMNNLGQISDRLGQELYTDVAAVPAYSWLGAATTEKPALSFTAPQVKWSMKDAALARQWAVQTKRGDKWSCEILPGTQMERALDLNDPPEALAVSALDRFGNCSPPSLLEYVKEGGAMVAR